MRFLWARPVSCLAMRLVALVLLRCAVLCPVDSAANRTGFIAHDHENWTDEVREK